MKGAQRRVTLQGFPPRISRPAMELTLLDGFILIVIGVGLVRGFMVGAVRQVLSLTGVLIAFLLSVQFMRPVGQTIAESVGLSADIAPLVGFVALFAGVQLVAIAMARVVERILDAFSLNLLNRFAGGLVGAVKTVLLLSVLFLVLAAAEMPRQEVRSASQFYRPVASALPKAWDATAGYLPAIKRVSDQFGAEVRQRLNADAAE